MPKILVVRMPEGEEPEEIRSRIEQETNIRDIEEQKGTLRIPLPEDQEDIHLIRAKIHMLGIEGLTMEEEKKQSHFAPLTRLRTWANGGRNPRPPTPQEVEAEVDQRFFEELACSDEVKIDVWNQIRDRRETLRELLSDVSQLLPSGITSVYGPEMQSIVVILRRYFKEFRERIDRLIRCTPEPRDKPRREPGRVGFIRYWIERTSFKDMEERYTLSREHIAKILEQTLRIQELMKEEMADTGSHLGMGDLEKGIRVQEWMERELERIRRNISKLEGAYGIVHEPSL